MRAVLVGLLIVGLVGSNLSSGWLSAQDSLPRRVALGVQVKPVSEETQSQLKLRNTRGVEVVSTLATSVAQAAGIKAGDVLLALGDSDISDVAGFVESVSALRAGKELPIKLRRATEDLTVQAHLKPLPEETSTEFDIEYSFVSTKVGRLRTVLTSPKGSDKRAAVLLLAGLGLGFVEHPTADPLGMKQMAYALTRAGFAVMRVDRPGCGDSEGGPARDADFESVVAGYIAAAQALKQSPKVNSDKLFLLGASAGALEAPLVAQQVPVTGIAIFGGLSMNWQEYLQSTTRRQLRLAGLGAGQVEQIVRLQSAGWHYLIYEKLAPDDIANEHEDLTEWVDQNWIDGEYFSGITYKFFQQLGEVNIPAAWEQFPGKVLAIWGKRDVVTAAEEHQLIVDIVNTAQGNDAQADSPNTKKARFLAIDDIDHNMQLSDTKQSGIDQVVKAVAAWIVEG